MNRIKQTINENSTGGININIDCALCNKTIIISNKYGMYCENMCGLTKDKIAYYLFKIIFPIRIFFLFFQRPNELFYVV